MVPDTDPALRAAGSAPPLFALVAGEDSGDQLGAELVAALRVRFPQARFVGIGGPRMRAADFEAWHDVAELSVMGVAEVLRHLPRLLQLRRTLATRIAALHPTAFIGIDAPDFNLGLETRLKRSGIRTVHYVSPSIWAWRQGRARKIGAAADRVLCLFPFEPPVYARYGVDARFVGHPLADRFPLQPDRPGARQRLRLADAATVLAVLPGSRLSEIHQLGAIFLDAARRVAAQVPGLQIVVPAANARCRAAIEALVPGEAVTLIDGEAHALLTAADVVLLASGTAALEAMLAKRPMVVGYRLARLTHALVKGTGMLKTDWYSLPNVLAGRALVPELMQQNCTPSQLASALLAWLVDKPRRDALAREFATLHESLRAPGGSAAAAATAIGDLLVARGEA